MSNQKVISVEKLTKQYDLGVIGTGTLSRDLNRWWARVRKQPDPYSTIGHKDAFERVGESILALDDISFTVNQGEALGIIGKNGAGKSTLLKILSRVTAPTSGSVKVKGRIGSLLEVGTGFHPELTGRENVYLNGAILGMRKDEVTRKFDEIVDFSGVGRFIDTPVKRYSSGMYVRLAFAVAAHLDPEILIVDEVLAVGDAEFQKKCLGKMGDVAEEGRTVLFVSHNMQAIYTLCQNVLFLSNGSIRQIGKTQEIVDMYLDETSRSIQNNIKEWNDMEQAPGNEFIRLHKVEISSNGRSQVKMSDSVSIKINFWNCVNQKFIINIAFYRSDNSLAFISQNSDNENWNDRIISKGTYDAECNVPGNLLNQGTYFIRVLFVGENNEHILDIPNVVSINVVDTDSRKFGYLQNWPGSVRPLLEWKMKKN